MNDQATGRVDPRALLRSVRTVDAARLRDQALGGLGRLAVLAVGAAVGLGAFGVIVVRANDDQGALAFLRGQVRQRPVVAAPQQPPRAAYPVSYFAPRGFFPTSQPTAQPSRRAPTQSLPIAQAPQRAAPIVASYAPFAGFFPTDAARPDARTSDTLRARSAPVVTRRASSDRSSQPISASPNIGGRVTYCVRTCDGFFFPLSTTTGSDKGDEAACNRVCPTAETKLYTGQIGIDMDESRSRQTGRRYAAMPNAFAYRTSFDKACSCNAGGLGLTAGTVAGDRTLKVGDIVMTSKGMRVFIGGQMPYREANFTSIDRAGSFAGQSRDTLRRMEQASLPGRSGVAQQRAPRRDELSDLRRAAASLETPGQAVRYVGPDRTSIAR
jgi:hypothetical protein